MLSDAFVFSPPSDVVRLPPFEVAESWKVPHMMFFNVPAYSAFQPHLAAFASAKGSE